MIEQIDGYLATYIRFKRHSRQNYIEETNKDLQILVQILEKEKKFDEFKKKAPQRFHELTEEENFLACFMLFANEFTRPLFYDEERMKTCCIRYAIRERKNGQSVFPISIPQWILSDDKDLNTKLEMLNKLLEISMYKACLHKILGVHLKQIRVEGRDTYDDDETSGKKFMLLPIGNYDYKYATPNTPLLPLFNEETHSEIIVSDNLPNNEAHNEYSGNLAYYGMPILNGLKVINNGSSAVNIYYIPVYEKRG